ncbi:MAG: tetratricopeptide repeat protein [Muribaculaceae bacterium]|nr:tetratricopeptide repeat protein [Muribaculaceae bacterium]
MRIGKKLTIGVTISLALFAAFAGTQDSYAKKGKNKEAKEARAKARYYYLEGLKNQVEGRHAEAYEYFRHAYNVDRSFPEAAFNYAQLRLVSRVDSLMNSDEQDRSMTMMRPYVDAFPRDYDEVIYYAYANARLDHLEEAIRIYERTDTLMPERTGTLLHLADAYFADGQDEKGFGALNRYEKIEGKSPNLTLKKISYLINRLDTVGAINEASSLVASNPREPAYLILKGNLFQLLEKQDSVEAYFKKAESIAPGYGAAKLALADFYLQQGDSAAYDNKTYEALLAEDFGLEEKAGLLSEYLQKLIYDKSNTKRGDYLFSVLEKQYPFETEVLDLAARYNAAKGNFDTAIEKISYAIDLDKTNETFWGQKMTYLISADRWKDAIATYDQAVKHITPNMGLMMLRASAAHVGEDYPLAIEAYGDIIKEIVPGLDPAARLNLKMIPSNLSLDGIEQLSSLYTTIGDCYFQAKNKEKAFEAYDNALTLDPENSMALNNYAYFTVESGGDIEKAANMSRRSLERENAENPTFLDTYAWILYKQGKYEEALEYQKKAIANSEGSSSESEELWNHYGDILLAAGDKAAALEAWKKALELADDKTELTKKINEHK